MAELGTRLILVCSNVQPDALGDIDRLAEQFHQPAERAGKRGTHIAYEALAWGTQIKLFSQVWAVVEKFDHPHLGLCLDSFHTLSLRDDPGLIAKLPGEKIFYVQLADAPWVNTDVLTHSRHYRCFPGAGRIRCHRLHARGARCRLHRHHLAGDIQRRVPFDTGACERNRRDALAAVARASAPDETGRRLSSALPASASIDRRMSISTAWA